MTTAPKDSDFRFTTGRVGNSRSRPGFWQAGARVLPLDVLDFFSVQDTDNAFALTVQRVKEILTGEYAKRIRLNGGLALARNANNTPPVMRGTYPLGVQIFVQPTDPALDPANHLHSGDVWVK